MIIIINGPLGVGKTDLSWSLIKHFDKAIMLDGDFIGAVHPFKIYDPEREIYLYRTIAHLIEFHRKNNYTNFVINYVFEKPESLNQLVDMVKKSEDNVHTFRLMANEEAMIKRIKNRGHTEIEWELKRFKELCKIMNHPDVCQKLGEVIDTSDLNTKQVAQKVFDMANLAS